LVSATIGATTLWMAGEISAHGIPSTLAVWWTGELLGALVVASVLRTWAAPREPLRTPRGVLEITLLCLGTVVAAELVLGRLPLLGKVDYLYLLFPFVMWAALRFGARGAS